MEKKIRIQLFDEDFKLIDDRMVAQGSEFYSGPKLQHNGPLRIEFTLTEKSDIEEAKIYLDKLTGTLPLESKSGKKKLKAKKELFDPNQREQILEVAIGLDNQDVLIEYLRNQGFKFMMSDFLKTFDFPGLEIKDKYLEKYQWMLLCHKEAKNPKVDKYDPMLVFGIQLIPERDEKVVVYLNGEFEGIHKIPIPDKPKEVFKKTGMIKFPVYMTEEEREKFRFEIRQYTNQPDKEFSKFFKRWLPYVENLPQNIKDKKSQEE